VLCYLLSPLKRLGKLVAQVDELLHCYGLPATAQEQEGWEAAVLPLNYARITVVFVGESPKLNLILADIWLTLVSNQAHRHFPRRGVAHYILSARQPQSRRGKSVRGPPMV
jgi:hypothetical protein